MKRKKILGLYSLLVSLVTNFPVIFILRIRIEIAFRTRKEKLDVIFCDSSKTCDERTKVGRNKKGNYIYKCVRYTNIYILISLLFLM